MGSEIPGNCVTGLQIRRHQRLVVGKVGFRNPPLPLLSRWGIL